MGCSSSKEVATGGGADEKNRTAARTDTGSISSHASTEPSTAFKTTPTPTTPLDGTVVVGNWKVRYSCLSRQGRDPEYKSKPNQDCYSVDEKVLKDEDGAFFAVYDGHGSTGHACSQFTQKRLPELVKEHLAEYLHDLFEHHSDIECLRTAMTLAHTETNKELRATAIDDANSGTTAISVFINQVDDGSNNSRITISNVGDSRAVLGTTSNGTLQALPLSNDQTPYRPNEAARCIEAGARILSFGQVDPSSNGEDDDDCEDPPRIWSKLGNFPGTAFTRSIGDSVAESLGVYAEPEVITLGLSPSEKVIVLASDGIFDVLSNQQVIDICGKHLEDPTQACTAIIEKSHEEWLTNDDCPDEASASYDDMTVICIFLDDASAEAPTTSTGTTVANEELPKSVPERQHSKRVRQKTLRNIDDMKSN